MLIRLVPRWAVDLLFRSFEARADFVHQVDELRLKYPQQPIAFATVGGGFLEFVAMRTFLAEKYGHDFELQMATRIPGLFIEPLSISLRRIASFLRVGPKTRTRIRLCADELKAGRPVVLNLEATDRKKPFEIPAGERELTYLAERVPELVVVPVVILWRKKRLDKQDVDDVPQKILRGLLAPIKFPRDVLLGDPMHPTFLRKVAILLRQYGRSTMRLSTPFEVRLTPPKMLRRRILTTVLQDRKVILGPSIGTPRFLAEGIFRHPNFQQLVQTIAAEEGTNELALMKRANKYLHEISATFSYFTIEMFAWALNWVFTRIFDNLTTNEEDLERLRLTSREGPLLLVPCHKSYFDFLILSYLLFRKDIAPPHIAAGINLSFWPFGPFARRAGAFFLRRSFKGNILYAEVFRRYVAALLQGRNNVEFFIEGARSRNGKLAPPKFGMLKMIVDSYNEGLIQEKIRIVPVSINYERVTEARAHKRELEGGEKVQESFVGLAKGTKVLFKRFGEVHVRLAAPIAFEDWLSQMGDTEAAPDAKRIGIQKLAFEICHRINRTTPLCGTGLVCSVLLAKPGASLSRKEYDLWIARIKEDLTRLGALLNPALERDYFGACERALRSLTEDGIIEEYESTNGRGIRVPQRQRIAALYYKNSVIHALVLPGVAGIAKKSMEDLLELRSLLQWEFFFAEKEIYAKTASTLPEGLATGFYAQLLDDVLENIAIGLAFFIESPLASLDIKEWKARLMKFGKAGILESSLTRLEGVNTQSFNAFLEMARNKKWLLPGDKEGEFRTGNPREIQRALDSVKRFRAQVPDWNFVQQQAFGCDPLHEKPVAPTSP